MESAFAIAEVLGTEGRESETLEVPHCCRSHKAQLAFADPTVANIAIFGGRQRETFIEPADIQKLFPGESQVIRTKELGSGGVGAVVFV